MAHRKFAIELTHCGEHGESNGATLQIERSPAHASVDGVLGALTPDDRYHRFGNGFSAAPSWLSARLLRDPAHRAYVASWAGRPVALLDYVEGGSAAEFGVV